MNPRRLYGTVLALGGLVGLLASGFYLLDYWREQHVLRQYLGGLPEIRGGAEDGRVIEVLTRRIGALPDGETTARMGYLNPLYDVVRARPVDVLRYGGFCGNKARLLIALLELRGIPARLVYLYNERGLSNPKVRQPYVTAVVEARLGDRWIVADPLLGVLFRNAQGVPATAAELAAAPALVRRQAPAWYDADLFDYRELRGVRWVKFPGGEAIRAQLARLVSEEWVDGMHYPLWVQRPNLLMSIVGAVLGVTLLASGLCMRRSGRSGTAGSAQRVGTCPV
jgi:hypothetical protein